MKIKRKEALSLYNILIETCFRRPPMVPEKGVLPVNLKVKSSGGASVRAAINHTNSDASGGLGKDPTLACLVSVAETR